MRTALPLLLILAALAPSARAQVQEDVFATRSERHHLVVGRVLRVTFEETPPHTIDENAHDPVVLVRSFSCGLETADFAVEWSSSGLPDKLMLEHTLGEWCTPAFDWKADRMLLVLDAEGKVRASSKVIDGVAPLARTLTPDYLEDLGDVQLPTVELDSPLIYYGDRLDGFALREPEHNVEEWRLDSAVLCRTTRRRDGRDVSAVDYQYAFTRGVSLVALWSGFESLEDDWLARRCDPSDSDRYKTIEIIDPR